MDTETQTYEHIAVSYLKSVGISITGYYPYSHATDIVGFLKLSVPFNYPVKVIAEIAKLPITLESIEGFVTLAKNASAEKLLLIAPPKLNELSPSIEKMLKTHRIDFVTSDIVGAYSQTTSGSQAKKDYENVKDLVSASKLIKELPTFAKQEIPADIQRIIGDQKLEAWQLLEDAVYCAFHHGLGCEVRQLGKEALFKNEPEGVVITAGHSQFALLYDCKSSSNKYKMSADDERAYIEYIRKKKNEVASLDRCELKYFLIISPDFAGDFGLRRSSILKKTQVILVLIKADLLRKLSLWSYVIPYEIKKLIELQDIFEEAIVTNETIESYIKTFNGKYKNRYGDGK